MRRAKTGSKAVKAKRSKTLGRRGAPKSTLNRRSSAAGQETEVARLARELREAREQQAATSEILDVISSSPGELGPVFEAILENATRICGGRLANLFLYNKHEHAFRLAAQRNAPAAYVARWAKSPLLRVGENPRNPLARLAKTKRVVAIPDLLVEPGYINREPRFVALVEAAGARTHVLIPMLKEGDLIGAIAVYRQEVLPFTDRQIELLRNFAAQAVIAVENTRLFDETSEALERQTATSDVLRVISSSPAELQPVFDAMLENATRICAAKCGILYRCSGDALRTVATYGAPQSFVEERQRNPIVSPEPDTTLGRALSTKLPVQIADILAEIKDLDDRAAKLPKLAGARTVLAVPMVKGNTLLGAILIYRQEVCLFTDKQVELVENFAAQAAIAIENTRLLNELRESLQQQTATADVLKVISRSAFDLQTVLQTLVESAAKLCNANSGNIRIRDGDVLRAQAFIAASEDLKDFILNHPVERDRRRVVGRAFLTGELVHVPDVLADREYESSVEWARRWGYRAMLAVPMVRAGRVEGTFSLIRTEPRAFSDREIELVRTFADQALIAIENVRLLDETKEALERQTATADILKVIASSPSNLQPVFDAIADRSNELMHGHSTTVFRLTGNMIELAAFTPINEAADAALRAAFPRLRSATGLDLAFRGEELETIDAQSDSEPQSSRDIALARGFRGRLVVPLKSDRGIIGAISITRKEPGAFAEKDKELLRTFADQAVIAIENARMFNEVQERTRDLSESLQQQTATADVLKVISRSAFELQSVLDTLVESAVTLSGAHIGTIFQKRGELFYLTAAYNFPGAVEYGRVNPVAPGFGTNVGRTAMTGAVMQIPDVLADPDFTAHGYQQLGNFRALLGIPLKRDGKVEGVFSLCKRDPGLFEPRHVELVQTFADQAVIAIENARLFDETQEALAHQTATSDVLQVIGSSMTDAQPVFERILDITRSLVGIEELGILLAAGDGCLHMAAHRGTGLEAFKGVFPMPIEETAANVVMVEQRQRYFADALNDLDAPPGLARSAEVMGNYSTVMTPMIWEGRSIGVIAVAREPNAIFSERELRLLQTFADQAVIAIQNVRLFNETKEALERQTATADILKVIASSPSDVTPVFEAIAESANRLIGGFSTATFRFIDGAVHLTAFTPINPEADQVLRNSFPQSLSGYPPLALIQNGETVQITDTEALQDLQRDIARARGFRSNMMSPLMSNGVAIGSINVTRAEPGAFAPHHVQLLQTFADQAVIAIENARLFNETKEALARQTATSDVLKVIASSPSKLQPVFDAIAERSKALIGAHSTVVVRYVEGMIELAAFTPVSPEADAAIRAMFGVPRPPTTGDPQTEQVLRGEIARIFDAESELQSNAMLGAARARGWRSRLLVPLKDDTGVIGWIGITRREPGGFAEKDVELLQTFADQAVIAINNVRLFEEVQERTRDLTDSLQQQTATADVLKVISASPGELEPVFQAMLENAVRLCEAKFAMLFLYQAEENTYRAVGKWNLPTAWAEFLGKNPLPADPRVPLGRVATTKQPVQVPDVLQDQAYIDRFPGLVAVAELGGARTLLQVPLLKENELVGAFGIYRQEVRPFTDKQVELVRNFAAQAVIAIENARLLNELRQRTSDLAESLQQQTATADVLQIISSSPGDLAPVFEKMLENATRVCGAEFGSMNLVEDDLVRQAALYNAPPAFAAARANAVRKPHPRGTLAEAIETKQVIHVADVRTTASYLEGSLASVELAELGGARTVAVVPMLRDNEVIGAITVYRQEIRLFDDKQIDLLSNFARQAVIAIENARLLRELRQRTDDLSKSLDDLRTAQDRLVQTEKLASLGQLTAGIAHEIKNPLNFVNNFSALSTELADELNAVLMQERLTDKGRQEVDELTGLLKDNLGKVVQHGKRADSIVKNMLLHSREGSGEQRAADINALVDESLNLAYHGARAEKSGFNITLQRDFDGSAGSAELFPQEITRALLNLISNGFYAATKRSNDGEAGFEPTLLAATKSLGNSVEIRIRDNGAGIPSEIKEKIFNPFFTTKPAGEGTGLGLSMSHDIIVKQHGGTIRVNTKLGAFTEFIITLPRAISVQSSQRSIN